MIKRVVKIIDKDGYGLDYEINKFIETANENEYIIDIKIYELERRKLSPTYYGGGYTSLGVDRIIYVAYLFIGEV